jgi:hypothetical protein
MRERARDLLAGRQQALFVAGGGSRRLKNTVMDIGGVGACALDALEDADEGDRKECYGDGEKKSYP